MERLGVMIVEDDPLILADLSTILDWDAEGCDLVTAANGRQGLHKFEQFRPMIVFTDVRMPFMDGLEMMGEIKRRNPYVQFLVLSAYDDFSPVQEALRQGARDYVLKQDISAALLGEKLARMRAAQEEEREFALNAIKNRLYELVSVPADDPARLQERLDGVLRLGGYFPDEALLRPARQFVMELLAGDEQWVMQVREDAAAGRAFFDALRVHLISRDRAGRAPGTSGGDTAESATVAEAKGVIRKRFRDPELSAKDIARAVGISYGRLSVLFKEETGYTINDYLTEVRMGEAKRLLCTGDHKIYEVAELTGYRSSQYFSYAFRTRVGCSPLQYRRGE